jgi:hypothetical protein
MNKLWKRAGSILLTGALLAGTIPFGASAAGTDSLLPSEDGAKIKVTYTEKGGAEQTAYYSNADSDDRNSDHFWDPVSDLSLPEKNVDTAEPITVTLLDNITLEDTTILVDQGKDVTIDGQGQYSITSNMTNAVTDASLPGNQAVSIATAGEALTLQNVELNINGTAAEDTKNANNGIVNYGTFTMGSASVVNIDGVKEGINGSGELIAEGENDYTTRPQLKITNVKGSALKANAVTFVNTDVDIDTAGAHGISVTDLTIYGETNLFVRRAAYYGIRATGNVSVVGTVDGSLDGTPTELDPTVNTELCGQETLNGNSFLPIVLGNSTAPSSLELFGCQWATVQSGETGIDNITKLLGDGYAYVKDTDFYSNLDAGSYIAMLEDSSVFGKISTNETGKVYLTNSTCMEAEGNVYTGETAEPVAAILHDASGKLEDDELYTDYGITTSESAGVVNVAITASDLRKHANGGSGNTEGYWVGFALAAPEGAEKVAYAFGASQEEVANVDDPIALEPNVTVDGKSGIAFYVDASAKSPKTWAKVQWAGAEGVPMGEATTYCMDLSKVSMAVDGVEAATLNDTSGAVAKDYLYDAGTYSVTATKTFGSEAYDVAITAKNVRTHYNGNTPTSLGAWVGYAVTAPAGAEKMKYAFSDTIPGEAKAYGLEEIFPGEKGVAVYYNAANPKDPTFTVQWLGSGDADLGTYTYTVDLSGVTVSTAKTIISSAAVKVNGEISPSVQAIISASTIAVSGLTASDTTSITLDIATTAGGTITKTFNLTHDDSGFSISDPEATVDICGTKYTVNVSGLTATPDNVEITTGEAATATGEGIDEADETTVTTALGNVNVADATTAVAQAAAQETAALVSDADQISAWLADANTNEDSKIYDTIQVVTYLDITATSYSAETGLTLDIVPSYKIVATNDSGDVSEALASGVLKNTSTAQPVSITVGVPDALVTAGKPVYIYHEKDSATYVYAGSVSGGTGAYTATFENPHGFSTFTVKTSAPAFVTDANNQITYYPTLQAAVDAAASTDVITVLQDGLSATAQKDVTVKNGTAATITVTINEERVELEAGAEATVEYTTSGGGIIGGGGGGTEEPAVPFTDVKEGDWFYEAVVYAYENNLMQGTSGTAFSPNVKMNRAMLVTILYRLEGEPAVSGDVSFTDVPDAYYTEAVAWAASNGLVEGYEDNTFKPTQNITREQFATILYRYAAFKKADTTVSGDLSDFTDAASTSTWAKDAMTWAVDNGIIQGVTPTTLAPRNTATRAQGAAMLMRFIENL